MIALAAALLAGATACHRNSQAEKLAALDDAYKSGVFTKEEYDARKQALLATPNAAAPVPTPAPAPAVKPSGLPDGATNAGGGAPAQADIPPVPAGAIPSAAVPPPAAPPVPAGAIPGAAVPSPASARRVPRSPAAPPAQPQAQMPPAPAGAIPSGGAPPPASARQAPRSPAAPPAPAGAIPGAAVPSPQSPPPQPQVFSQSNGADREEPEPAPLAGCRDAGSRSGGAKGVQERVFPASVEEVRKAASLALRNLDFVIHKDDSHEMEGSRRRHLGVVVGAGGERVILHYERAPNGTRVTGETKKSLVGRLAQKTWTSAVLAQIACNLRTAGH